MRRRLILVIFLLMLTGCTKLDNNIESIVNVVLNAEQKVNTVSTNYKIYVPNGLIQIEDNEYNQKFKFKDRYIYLYVDTISYHFKNHANYENTKTYNYFYKKLNNYNKTGYLGIDQIDNDLFYVKLIYNYAKIEFYSNQENLSLMVTNSLLMVNSIKYNDNLITASLGDDKIAGKDIKYELDTPEGTESSFNDVLQQYVIEEEEQEEVVLPDEE